MLQDQQIPLFKVFMAPTVIDILKTVLYSGYITQGPQVEEFEKNLCEFLNVPYVATVNSGTTALHLALDLCNVQEGDEVITTPMTCTATNWPILAHNAKIVWADVEPNTGNIDPQSIKSKITKKTKAIMVVDWGGYPCDIDAIRKIAPGILIIEDAAHAFGSLYKGKKVGHAADYTCFSFQAIKHLTTVDGGALIVKTNENYERAVLKRYFGIDRRKRSKDYRIEKDIYDWGYKFHMNDVNASIGIENLKHITKILSAHRGNARYYMDSFVNIPEIELMKEMPDYLSSYWLFTMKVKDVEPFMEYMKAHGVMASQVHRRNDNHPVTRQFVSHLPGVDDFSKHMVCLPVGWWVTKKDREYIADLVKKYYL